MRRREPLQGRMQHLSPGRERTRLPRAPRRPSKGFPSCPRPNIARRPLHAKQDVLGDRLAAIAELDPEALAALTNVIDALITKSRLRILTDDIS